MDRRPEGRGSSALSSPKYGHGIPAIVRALSDTQRPRWSRAGPPPSGLAAAPDRRGQAEVACQERRLLANLDGRTVEYDRFEHARRLRYHPYRIRVTAPGAAPFLRDGSRGGSAKRPRHLSLELRPFYTLSIHIRDLVAAAAASSGYGLYMISSRVRFCRPDRHQGRVVTQSGRATSSGPGVAHSTLCDRSNAWARSAAAPEGRADWARSSAQSWSLRGREGVNRRQKCTITI